MTVTNDQPDRTRAPALAAAEEKEAKMQPASQAAVIKNVCSGCLDEFRLNTRALTVTMRVPSNGLRGAKHQGAHDVTAEVEISHDGVLYQWECPRCEYADSIYVDDEVRRDLAG